MKVFRNDQRGFTMVTVLLAMMVLSFLAVGAYAGVTADMPIARKDQDRKRAYEAAQAGVDWYLNQLRADPEAWQQCAGSAPTADHPLTIEDAGSQGMWKLVDGNEASPAPTDTKFRVEILKGKKTPTAVATACDPGNASGTALDPEGIFWIRSTGLAGGKTRSVLAGLRQNSDFLRYVYFSNWENQDPQLANVSNNWNPVTGNGGSQNQCDYTRATRDGGPLNQLSQVPCLQPQYLSGDTIRGSFHTNDDGIMGCGAQFGGLTSSDVLEIAGATTTTWNTRYPTMHHPSPYSSQRNAAHICYGGGATTSTAATIVAPAPVIQLPPSNVRLLKQAEAGGGNLVLQGQTCLVFKNDGTVDIYDRPGSSYGAGDPANANSRHKQWGSGAGSAADPKRVHCGGQGDTVATVTPRNVAMPAGGIIYVRNLVGAACTPRIGHNAATSYTSSPSCGDVAVSGTYSRSVTVAAENDIVINGNLEKSGDAMLGLIANGFVRIYHPMTNDPYRYANQEGEDQSDPNYVWQCYIWGWDGSCWWSNSPAQLPACAADPLGRPNGRQAEVTNTALYTKVTKIEAAILSMQHSFITDNMNCPNNLGALQITGSISTYWGSTIGGCAVLGCTGYLTRNWTHDTRFKTGQPPHFIAPLNSDGRWVVNRRTEQIPTPVTATG